MHVRSHIKKSQKETNANKSSKNEMKQTEKKLKTSSSMEEM